MAASVKVKGLKELGQALQTLPAKLQANALRSAMRAGAKQILEEARERVPVDTQELKDSLRVSTRSRRGVVTASVKAGGKTAWYAGFVEFGTAAHTIIAKNGGHLRFGGHQFKSVDHPGARPQPFMRPALDTRASEAVQAVAASLRKRLADKHGLNVPAPLEEGDE